MALSQVINTRGIYRDVDDYRTGQDSGGVDLDYPQEVYLFRADAAITKGQLLMDVAPTATVPLSVTPMTSAIGTSDPWAFVGVAKNAAAAGDDVEVVVWGYCTVNTDTSDTPAARSLLGVPNATTGAAEVNAAATIAAIGRCVSVEVGTSDTCFGFIGPVVRPDTIV